MSVDESLMQQCVGECLAGSQRSKSGRRDMKK